MILTVLLQAVVGESEAQVMLAFQDVREGIGERGCLITAQVRGAIVQRGEIGEGEAGSRINGTPFWGAGRLKKLFMVENIFLVRGRRYRNCHFDSITFMRIFEIHEIHCLPQSGRELLVICGTA